MSLEDDGRCNMQQTMIKMINKRGLVLILTIAAAVLMIAKPILISILKYTVISVTAYISVTAVALLVLFLMAYDKDRRMLVLTPVVYCVLTLYFLVDLIAELRNPYFESAIWLLLFLGNIVGVAAGVCGVIGSLKGFSKKSFVAASFVGMTLEFCFQIANLVIYFVWVMEKEKDFSIKIGYIFPLLPYFGMILFAVALLILGLNNTFPSIINGDIKLFNKPRTLSGTNISAPSAADELRALKADFDAGKLSEEEYNAKRAELIKKL